MLCVDITQCYRKLDFRNNNEFIMEFSPVATTQAKDLRVFSTSVLVPPISQLVLIIMRN